MGKSRDFSHIFERQSLLLWFLFPLFILLASACQPPTPACPPESVTYLTEDNPSLPSGVQDEQKSTDQLVEINGKEIRVDQIIEGVLCSGDWSGIVYVPCEVQLYAWDEDPLFLENCDLNIAPDTTVYVAAHNNEPYYKGCSCHTGEIE